MPENKYSDLKHGSRANSSIRGVLYTIGEGDAKVVLRPRSAMRPIGLKQGGPVKRDTDLWHELHGRKRSVKDLG